METHKNRKHVVQIGLLSALFVAAYFVLRALPDAECGFLHYEEVVNADGEIEFCATNHASFLDLSRLQYPVKMNLSVEGERQLAQALPVGQVAKIELELLTPGGMGIAPHQLAITHTERMHVMLIDPSLEDYHHVHPQPIGNDGHYWFEFTPRQGGEYQVFTEIVPVRTRRQVIATGTLATEGTPQVQSFSRRLVSEAEGLRFELANVPPEIRTRADNRFSLRVFDAQGNAAKLESIMGAKGHLVAFDAERRGFAHMHPISDPAAMAAAGLTWGDGAQPSLDFLFNVPNPGWYRIFAQVKVNGKEVFGSFDLAVK